MSCPHCKGESWHSATVCGDCGLPYGPGKPKAITDLERELQEAIVLLGKVDHTLSQNSPMPIDTIAKIDAFLARQKGAQ